MNRVPHTDEDNEVFQKNMRRILSQFGAGDMVAALLHACWDYMEPCPKDWTEVVLANERREAAQVQRIILAGGRRWGGRDVQRRQIQHMIDRKQTVFLVCSELEPAIEYLEKNLRAARLKIMESGIEIKHDPRKVAT